RIAHGSFDSRAGVLRVGNAVSIIVGIRASVFILKPIDVFGLRWALVRCVVHAIAVLVDHGTASVLRRVDPSLIGTLVVGVRHAVPIVVRVGTAILVLEAVSIFSESSNVVSSGTPNAAIHVVVDAVGVDVRIGTTIMVGNPVQVFGVLWTCVLAIHHTISIRIDVARRPLNADDDSILGAARGGAQRKFGTTDEAPVTKLAANRCADKRLRCCFGCERVNQGNVTPRIEARKDRNRVSACPIRAAYDRAAPCERTAELLAQVNARRRLPIPSKLRLQGGNAPVIPRKSATAERDLAVPQVRRPRSSWQAAVSLQGQAETLWSSRRSVMTEHCRLDTQHDVSKALL